MTGSYQQNITNAVAARVSESDREHAMFALRTPDLYPARSLAAYLGVSITDVHAWRRERGIKKARS